MEVKGEIFSWLKELNTNKNKNWPDRVRNQAPHKPFLLLSILDGIEQGWINLNQIELSPELHDAFFRYWNSIMGNRNTKVTTPFKHLDFEPFWSLKNSKNAVIDEMFFQFIKKPEGRDYVRRVLLRNYFTNEAAYEIAEMGRMSGAIWEYSQEIDKMVDDEFIAFKSSKGKKKLTEVEKQKRDNSFSFSIKRNYNHHCAVCGTKVITPDGASLVVGAHIIPWSVSFNDDPRNGISLCKNHHWLFDNWMYTITSDFTVKISKFLSSSNQYFKVEEIENKKISLPAALKVKPAEEALLYHNEEFEKYNDRL